MAFHPRVRKWKKENKTKYFQYITTTSDIIGVDRQEHAGYDTLVS